MSRISPSRPIGRRFGWCGQWSVEAYDPMTLRKKASAAVRRGRDSVGVDGEPRRAPLAYSNALGVRVVDVRTRKELARFPFPNTSLEFDRTGKRLLVVSVSPPRVTLVDVPTRRTLGRLGLAAQTFAQWPSATFLANGAVVATIDGLFLDGTTARCGHRGRRARSRASRLRRSTRAPTERGSRSSGARTSRSSTRRRSSPSAHPLRLGAAA